MVDYSRPHRRHNPLTGEWILVSPHRAARPWNGTIESPQRVNSPDHDADCYLCPDNTRSNGEKNPQYEGTFVFTNDHSAMLPDTPPGTDTDTAGLFQAAGERGICRVICYTPKHNQTMADLTEQQIVTIINTWKSEYETIGKLDQIGYVQIFENKGPLMGASSPHPHGQLWANEHLPTTAQKEQDNQKIYLDRHSQPLLSAYLALEQKKNVRVVMENDAFAVVVPFWATWPFETMVLPKNHKQSLSDFTPEEDEQLATLLKRLTVQYDRIFHTSFPYSMGIHQKPTDGQDHPEWQFHIHFYPPLLRSATVKKYFVGYEMFAEGQRDITPEAAVKILKEVHG